MLARTRTVPITAPSELSGSQIDEMQLLETYVEHGKRIGNENPKLEREQAMWVAGLAIFRQYWTEVEEIILRYSATTGVATPQTQPHNSYKLQSQSSPGTPSPSVAHSKKPLYVS
ncbi:hypothetical protein ACEPPN_012366 [Leptodophora sp. 'Broadleaf-Isolate-01']